MGAVTGFVLPFVDGVVDFLVVNISYFGIAIGIVAGLVFTLLAERVVRCGQVGSGMVVAALGVWACAYSQTGGVYRRIGVGRHLKVEQLCWCAP